MYHHYHFIGIGGIGMGTLASLMMAKGYKVSGSDLKESPMTQRLRTEGAIIVIGHHAENIQGADFIVFSSAINGENPELVAAQKQNKPILQRAKLLAQLMENQIGITIAGAHGKTTTTSMISFLLIQAGLNPTTAVGGIINGDSYNASLGDGRYFVAEVDESDGSFLFFAPCYSVITNIDFEHVDFYHDWTHILKAYKTFIERTDSRGIVVACGDDERLNSLLRETRRNSLTFGMSHEADVYADHISSLGYQIEFDCFFRGRRLGRIGLSIPGRHNVLNALACICLGRELKIDFHIIQKSLKAFQGVNRRFQIKGNVGGIFVVDDYGHHPTEIAATLQTAQRFKKNRLITVFQPHRYTRTKFLMEEFVKSLALSDYLIITDIYAASEPPIEGVSAQKLLERLTAQKTLPAVYLKKGDIIDHLIKITQPGDLVLTLGAGDITKIASEFVEILKNKKNDSLAMMGDRMS